jgi:uroporphyrin-III C-methyltransferase / precorrin-2 dehydrogenase / sirohydrochlorin ferrochelatase
VRRWANDDLVQKNYCLSQKIRCASRERNLSDGCRIGSAKNSHRESRFDEPDIPPRLDLRVEYFAFLQSFQSLKWKFQFVNRRFFRMRFLPVFLDTGAGHIVLAGSGHAAPAKLALLLAADAKVHWFAGASHSASTQDDRVEFFDHEPTNDDLKGALAVICAYGDERDAALAARARMIGIPVNVVDRPQLSTFILPAIVDRGDVVVAIGTGGASPVLARRLREKIEAILPARIGAFAALLRRYREPFAAARHAGVSLRGFWEQIVDGPVASLFLSGREAEAEAALSKAVADSSKPLQVQPGAVHLVGAGPGDPDLLTLRAVHLLQAADVVFYDDLIGPEILGRARRDAPLHFVGKRKGEPGIGQEEINRRLVEAAREGKQVVRLKGGDPFIFGRGGEELEHLRQAGIDVTVVPGITAALGCAAEAALPLTFRKEATRVTFITANTAEGAGAVDWASLGGADTTAVVYMGLTAASAVRDGLIGAGRDRDTPAAVLARGTLPNAQTVVGKLHELPALAARAGNGPALLVIGETVARSDAWRALARLEAAA